MCLGTKWRRGHKWHNMVVKQGRRMTGVGYTDWHCTPCFVHLLPATPAVTCQPLQLPLATRGNDVFIFLYVHRLTHRVYTTTLLPDSPSLRTLIASTEHEVGRLRFFSKDVPWRILYFLYFLLYSSRMIKFIRSRKLGLEGI